MATAVARDARADLTEQLLNRLGRPEGEAAWARDARAAARARLVDMGAPLRRDEYWKYTDPTALTGAEGAGGPASPFGLEGASVLDFTDGALATDLTALTDAAAEIMPLGQVLGADISFAKSLFGALEAAGHEKVHRPLAALSTATATEGLVLRATGKVSAPLHLRYAGAGRYHHVIRVESGAEVTVVETGVPTATTMEIDVAAGGVLHHVRLQDGARDPSVSHIFARIGEGGVFKTFTLTADGSLTRNEVVFDLVGDSALGHSAGAILAAGDSHIDNTIFVTHSGLNGESRQVFKSVLDGKGRSVFQGKIFVRQAAQKTDGYQISQSILLSDTAEFDVKPELEIYADDVKCSHGSTTGEMDADALYYLRARGVPYKDAEAMLVAAFVDEAVMEIDDEGLAGTVRAAVADWMNRR